MNKKEAMELTRLINCLVSPSARDDLYSRFDDDDLLKQMNGLTPELAEVGISWWSSNRPVFEEIITLFQNSLFLIAQKSNVELESLIKLFDRSVWADFIRESFYFECDVIAGEKTVDEINEFMTYAVKMSLEYSGNNEYSPDLLGANIEVFRMWWNEQEPSKLFDLVFTLTLSGCELINRSQGA